MKRPSAVWVRRVGAVLFVAVLALGWRFPYLGYCLLANVVAGLVLAVRHGGRHGCGNFCPRGAFYSMLPDTGRKVPPGLLAKNTSVFALAALLAGLFAWLRPATVREWGFLFWAAVAATTAVGLAGWLVFNRYFWCSVCPMGKILKTINPGKSGIRVGDACVKCGQCAKACPFAFCPPETARDGVFRNPDCLSCGRCIGRCPRKALSFAAKT